MGLLKNMGLKNKKSIIFLKSIRRLFPTSIEKLIHQFTAGQPREQAQRGKFHQFETNLAESRSRKLGVSVEHLSTLTEMLNSDETSNETRKSIVEAMHKTEACSFVEQQRRMSEHINEHYWMLLQLKESMDAVESEQLRKDIEEAVYALDAISKSQKRRKALVVA